MNNLFKNPKLFLVRNSSTILTCVGAAGVVATTVAAIKATPRAIDLIKEAEREKGEELTKLEKVQVAGPSYIPTVLIGASTLACIFGANSFNKKQQASLMSAYALVDTTLKEYKAKVKEIHGEEGELQIRREIIQERYVPVEQSLLGEKRVFFDGFSLQSFESTMEEVLRAEDNFNKMLSVSGYAALNEFYDTLGIARVDYGYELGWSLDAEGAFYRNNRIDFVHEKVILDDGMEICVITMSTDPVMDYMGF